MTRSWVIGLLAVALACSTPVRTESLPTVEGRSIERICVAPPHVDLSRPEAQAMNGGSEGEAGGVVVARLLEALERSGRYETISPAEVRQALGVAGVSPAATTPGAIGQVVKHAFGADSVLFVHVRRFVPRRGGERGAVQGASVWFQVELRASEGTLLWKGEYDETQKGLTDDLSAFRRALARGFRWVSSEELAAYGAAELVERMPGRR